MITQGKIYFDMDGVLADFKPAAEKLMKQLHCDIRDGKFWQAVKDTKGEFFANLQPIPEVKEIVEEMDRNHYNINILSKVPYNCIDEAIYGKVVWINKHFPNTFSDVIFVPSYNDKEDYCRSRYILIDDYEKNVSAWRGMGGMGIYYQKGITDLQVELHQIFAINPSAVYKIEKKLKE